MLAACHAWTGITDKGAGRGQAVALLGRSGSLPQRYNVYEEVVTLHRAIGCKAVRYPRDQAPSISFLPGEVHVPAPPIPEPSVMFP